MGLLLEVFCIYECVIYTENQMFVNVGLWTSVLGEVSMKGDAAESVPGSGPDSGWCVSASVCPYLR